MTTPMRLFRVQIKRGGQVLKSLEAMGPDSCTVVAQHIDLCTDGEVLSVMSAEAFYAQQRAAENDRAALALQINRPSELERAIQGNAA